MELKATDVLVTEVKAINLREVVVTFNQPVDEITAKDAANYTANQGITFSAPILSADKTEVTVYASGNLSKTINTTVTVKDVKSTDKTKTLASVSNTVKGIDDAIPTVASVEVLGPLNISITFSEPVQNADAEDVYTLNGTALAGGNSAAEYVAGSHNKVVMITLNGAIAMPIGEQTLLINDGTNVAAIKDFDNKPLQPRSVKLTVTEDTTIPAVTGAQFVDQTTVRVTFNKAINLSEGQNYTTKFYWNTNGTEGFTQYPSDTTNTILKVNANTVDVKFTTNPLTPGTVYFFATGVTDFNGVSIDTSKTQLTATAEGALVVSSITSPQDNQIKLTFNRTVTTATAQTASNYTIKNSAGVAQAISGAVKSGSNGNIVTLTTTSVMPGGAYTVDVKNIKDTLNNTITTTTLPVTVNDTTPITSFAITPVAGASSDKIVVTYPEAMMTSGTNGIATKARYEVQVAGGGYNALASGDTVTASDDGKSATITFAADTFAAAQSIDVRINLISDVSGNVIPNKLTSNATSIDETSGIDISTITPQITGARTIKLTVPRQLSAISSVDFLLNDGTTDFTVAKDIRCLSLNLFNLTY